MSMQLLPPSESLHCSIELLIKSVNEHADLQGYAVTKKRFKKFKKDVIMKVWLCCDRVDVTKIKDLKHHFHTFSRCNECSFEVIAKLNDNEENLTAENDCWHLFVKCLKHNHFVTLLEAHSVHWKMIMTFEIIREIEKKIQKSSVTVFILTELRLDLDEENSIFKSQNIWNARAQIKAQSLESLMFTQTVIRALNDKKIWHMKSKKKLYSEKLKFLFFTLKCMQKLLHENFKILIMNCIYKINKYKMLLLIIIEIMSLNIFYYIIFCFIKDESFNDYMWVMKALKRLSYKKLVLSFSEIILSDDDKTFASVIQHMFENYDHVTYALCIWHINNMLKHCKKFFVIQKNFELFLKCWKALVYSCWDRA